MYTVNKNSNVIIATILGCLVCTPTFAIEKNDEREKLYGSVSVSRVIDHSNIYDVFVTDNTDQQRKNVGQFQSASNKSYTFSYAVDELPDTFRLVLCPQDGQLTDCIYSDSIENPATTVSMTVPVTLQSTLNFYHNQNRPEQAVSFVDRVRQQAVTNIQASNYNNNNLEMQGSSVLSSNTVAASGIAYFLVKGMASLLIFQTINGLSNSLCHNKDTAVCTFLGHGGNNGFDFSTDIQSQFDEIKDRLIIMDQKSDYISTLLQSMYTSDIMKEFNDAEGKISTDYAKYMGQLNQTLNEQGLTGEQADQYIPQARELEVIYDELEDYLISIATLFDHEGQISIPYIPNPLKIGIYYQAIADRYYSGEAAVGGDGYEFAFRWTDPHTSNSYYVVTPHLAILFQDYTIRTLVALTKWYTMMQMALSAHSYYTADQTIPTNDPAKTAAANAAYFIFELLGIEPCTDMEICTQAINEIFDRQVEVLREVNAQYTGLTSAYTLRDVNTHSVSAIILKAPSKLLMREDINNKKIIENIESTLADIATLQQHLPESDYAALNIARNQVIAEYDRMAPAGVTPEYIGSEEMTQLYKAFLPASTESESVNLSDVLQRTGGLIFSGVAGPQPMPEGVGRQFFMASMASNNSKNRTTVANSEAFFNQDGDRVIRGFWTYQPDNESFYEVESNVKNVTWSGDNFIGGLSSYKGLMNSHLWDYYDYVTHVGRHSVVTMDVINLDLNEYPTSLHLTSFASNGGCVFDFGSYNSQKQKATNCMVDVQMPTLIVYDEIDNTIFKRLLYNEILTINASSQYWRPDYTIQDRATIYAANGISVKDVDLKVNTGIYDGFVTFDKTQQNENTVIVKPRLIALPWFPAGQATLTITVSDSMSSVVKKINFETSYDPFQ